jgi:hypothetical protein
MPYFVEEKTGAIWEVSEDGETLYPRKVHVVGDRIQILVDLAWSEELAVENEYILWPTLTALALALEHDHGARPDGSMTLDMAVSEVHHQVESFKAYWLEQHEKYPIGFPLMLEANSAGLWLEQMYESETELPAHK